MIRLAFHTLFVFFTALRTAVAVSSDTAQKPLKRANYATGASVPITCLNRTIETGEHISDEKGHLQYIPFLTCNETSLPLSLTYGLDTDLNCTIPFITDPLFHLLEFYIHNDSPLACRMPARPLSPATTSSTLDEEDDEKWIPIIFALTGTLQLSHLHIANHLNIIVHDAPSAPGVIDSAIAYSVSTNTKNTRIVIGDALPLVLSVRWFVGPNLPRGWRGVGGHLTGSTVLYCLLSTLAGCAVSIAWFRGYELPRRLRRYGIDRLGGGGDGGDRGGYGYSTGNGGYGGYGYGHGGNGNGVGGYGKRD